MTQSSEHNHSIQLVTHLTSGWPTIPKPHWLLTLLRIESEIDRSDVKNKNDAKNRAFKDQLQKLLTQQTSFPGVDALFRKNTNGFQPIKRFFATLKSLDTNNTNHQPIHLHIDAFTYSFLQNTKNFDLLIPLKQKHNQAFLEHKQQWSQTINQLKRFERNGHPINPQLQDQYLKFRKILARRSARDELRALGILLINGPSTLEQISQDLGLSYTLSQRVAPVFEPAAIVEHRAPPSNIAIKEFTPNPKRNPPNGQSLHWLNLQRTPLSQTP